MESRALVEVESNTFCNGNLKMKCLWEWIVGLRCWNSGLVSCALGVCHLDFLGTRHPHFTDNRPLLGCVALVWGAVWANSPLTGCMTKALDEIPGMSPPDFLLLLAGLLPCSWLGAAQAAGAALGRGFWGTCSVWLGFGKGILQKGVLDYDFDKRHGRVSREKFLPRRLRRFPGTKSRRNRDVSAFRDVKL